MVRDIAPVTGSYSASNAALRTEDAKGLYVASGQVAGSLFGVTMIVWRTPAKCATMFAVNSSRLISP